ncbi:MAG: C39 family peptidase, partial [Chloroflexota bacterium]|nr:C39 family peptidase [Chloroflexota bacterium]
SAQNASIDAWAEVATANPGVGCAVDVSVEVRSGGAGLAGADISLVVSDDASGATVSSDATTADGSGIAWLTIDTSGTSAGDKTWMNILVNGVYVGGQTIWITDGGSCSGAPSLLDLSGDVPVVSGGSAPADAEAASSGDGSVMIPGVSAYKQQRGLSCEYASLSIATGMLGNWISEYDFDPIIPLNDNPHSGYRGDITGIWGNTTDYGIYNEPLVPALGQFGFSANAFYGGRADLTAQLDMGRPTLVWIGVRGDEYSFYEYTADGARYQLTQYMHVVVVYGYDEGGVHISDPGNGSLSYMDWGTFEWMWGVMDGMALAVHW